ncbi:MAG TPA: isoaspartyl peptidase/L-asparaginase [Dokdonella sp.]|uniref:isoaspartyl peptidase/L-asparaginase family protein n=1 Tax=Dokdonella sp. TaxID=2291710 RepID=UPI0025B9AFDC|nr:isoaspartyl peptidase/L-asparaginase [Dokdonella sp.]MBX3690790.1 isoaspartyl peptidase/L-asparaginase [Dokdonella sp.]MCW5566627.1 isoaspartyl peptidase/L-asparaginase [Dokdonella sp.]HNR91696.1 isoaspartyl peptidase/L-asparaginase [Dokdonella sp.]
MTTNAQSRPPLLLVHGGAGVIRATLTPAIEAEVKADLTRALQAGHAILAAGGGALDAVEAAVVVLEDSPHFNAGHGAVFTHEGINELDASVMDGPTRRAGAVAGVRHVRNPVALARAVMERSDHVLLIGEGAEAFAHHVGAACVDPAYFRTETRWQQLQEAIAKEHAGEQSEQGRAIHYGTVGAVALDAQGHLAAATSTGGMTNKRWGRVGDSPLIGAGTWADDRVAVSATGWGEYFIRAAVAHDIAARIAYAGSTLAQAAAAVIDHEIPRLGGDGGIIAIDAAGHFSLAFNTDGMYRGWIGADGIAHAAILAGDVG